MCARDFLDIRIPRIILSFLGQFRYPYIEVTLYLVWFLEMWWILCLEPF
jgi:hypothetical protein